MARGHPAESNPGTGEQREVGAVPPRHQSRARFRTALHDEGPPSWVALRLFSSSEQSDGEAYDQRPDRPEHAEPGEEALEGAVIVDALEEEDPDHVGKVISASPVAIR